jgi:hypothetical protein
MRRLMCRLGRHVWQRKSNPEASGADAVYEQCVHCAKERATYGRPPPTGVAGGGM